MKRIELLRTENGALRSAIKVKDEELDHIGNVIGFQKGCFCGCYDMTAHAKKGLAIKVKRSSQNIGTPIPTRMNSQGMIGDLRGGHLSINVSGKTLWVNRDSECILRILEFDSILYERDRREKSG